MSVLIKGGRIITAADDYVADIYVEDETVTLIGESLDMSADKVIDASGKYVLPGLVDPHTHLDMPFGGTVTIDDVESGQTAAAFGGTTCTSTSSSSRRARASPTRSPSGARRPTASR
jgi:dihydropyrimidinase